MSLGSRGEGIIHIGGVTMRILGNGVLRMEVNTLQDVRVKPLVGFQMNPISQFEPTRKTNFRTQRLRLHGYVNDIDEGFRISTIILWVKPVAKSLPGNKSALPGVGL